MTNKILVRLSAMTTAIKAARTAKQTAASVTKTMNTGNANGDASNANPIHQISLIFDRGFLLVVSSVDFSSALIE
ncbi:hypothetical protein [Leuconostoc mesenteroides]|uniref:hypothetical protein n=2 Tax=Lactobacillaceae TaxID=33958 RepID=UPI00373FCCE0